tara:strand:- start:1604 stop:2443 length:840 start_codon:yes stop_codon:yes gene_type:complete
MAIDKGKQFEYAVVVAAYNKAGSQNLTQEQLLKRIELTPKITDQSVMVAGNEALDKIQKKVANVKWNTFKQLGGGNPEPKTDVICNGNIKISCKWEDGGYQLASGNPSFTYTTLKNAVDSAYEYKNLSKLDYEQLADAIDVYDQAFSKLGTQPRPGIDAVLKRNKSVIDALQLVIGQGADAGGIYEDFNRCVVRESLTGEALFGEMSEKTANYVLGNKSGFHPINSKYVNEVAKYYKVRIASLKGRGKTPQGVRRNEIAGRFEITGSTVPMLISSLSAI